MSVAAARLARTTTPAHSSDGASSRASASRAVSTPTVSPLALRSAGASRLMLFPIQPKLEVNQPNDRFEREADAVADNVMRLPVPEDRTEAVKEAQNPRHIQRTAVNDRENEEIKAAQNPRANGVQLKPETPHESSGGKILRFPDIQRAGDGHTPAVSASTARIIQHPGAGQPLSPSVRRRVEPHVGADLSHVRVHAGTDANRAAASLRARAFTYQNHIFLNRNESPGNTRLIAHEAAHVVQQGAAPVQRFPNVQRAETPVQERARPPNIQRSWLDSLASGVGAVWDATGGRLVDAAGNLIEMGVDFFWSIVEEIAPNFVPILRRIQQEGILGYLGGLIRDTFSSIFDGLTGDTSIFGSIAGTFGELLATAQTILAALTSGECEPLFAAVNQLVSAVQQMAGEAWDAIVEFFRPIGDFFSTLWQRFGAPVIDWLSNMAGEVWQFIQDLGARIWSWTQPIRDSIGAAWNWIKEQLFGPEDPSTGSSEGGLIGWISSKASEAWGFIQAELEPIITPIRNFVDRIVSFLPLDAISIQRERAQSLATAAQNTSQNMSQPQDVTQNQTSLRETILPAILSTIQNIGAGISSAGQWVSGTIGGIVETVNGVFDGIRSISLLSPVAGAIGWLQDGVNSLAQWAQGTVGSVFDTVAQGLVRLSEFITPILDMLQQLVGVISDLVGHIGSFIAGIWNRIPECIRVPIQRFIIDNILSNIPIFGQLLQIPDIWARVSETAMTILRQVFVDGDLAGAAWTFFRSLLSLLGIPPELVVNIIAKAATAIADILGDPVGFFINLLSAVKLGFQNFFSNILTHLLAGVANWLFSELEEANIRPPQDLSLRSIIAFVLDVLGISVDNFFERLGLKIGREQAQRVRRVFDLATGAIRWVYRLVTEGPGALWEEIQSQLSSLWNMVLNAVIGWVTREIIDRATVRLLSMLDPTGIMAVVNSMIAIYNAIQSFVRYMREILEVINTTLDGINGIARGDLAQAATFLENSLANILPIAIGFLANQVGLSGIGRRIGEMVETVREYVNQGIDWLIDTGISALQALIAGGRAAVGAVTEWWRERRQFRDAEGELHSMYFEQRGQNYQLMIASNPRNAELFLNNLIVSAANDPLRRQAILLAQRIDSATASTPQVRGWMNNLTDLINQIHNPADKMDGTIGKPYWIIWHKPRSSHYPPLIIRTAPYAQERTVTINERTPIEVFSDFTPPGTLSDFEQNFMYSRPIPAVHAAILGRAGDIAAGRVPGTTTSYTGTDVTARQQMATTAGASFTGGISFATFTRGGVTRDTTRFTIGVTPQYLTRENTVVGPSIYSSSFADTNVKALYRRVMNAAVRNRIIGFAVEHVTDMMYGGPDIFENLWLLETSKNFPPNQVINTDTGKDIRITPQPDASKRQEVTALDRGKYFIIKGFAL